MVKLSSIILASLFVTIIYFSSRVDASPPPPLPRNSFMRSMKDNKEKPNLSSFRGFKPTIEFLADKGS